MKKTLYAAAMFLSLIAGPAIAGDVDLVTTFTHQNIAASVISDGDGVKEYQLRGRVDAIFPVAEDGSLEGKFDVLVTRDEAEDETAAGFEIGAMKTFDRGTLYGQMRVEYVSANFDYTRVTPIIGATYSINSDFLAFAEVATQQNVDNGDSVGDWADIGVEYVVNENLSALVSARREFNEPGVEDSTRARVELVAHF